jgi:opine dehydrogenase
MLSNAWRIEVGESFDFYAEGVTPSVAATLADADAERLRIAGKYGVPVSSLSDWIAESYGHHAETLREALRGNPAYAGIKAPTTLAHRYLLEDVPTGLIPLIELGRAAGLPSPTLGRLVERSRAALGSQGWQRPRTLDALGLAGMDPEEICTFVQRGLVPVRSRGERVGPIPMGHLGSGWELVPQTS